MQQTANNKRMQKDVTKLVAGKYTVIIQEGKFNEFIVIFFGPENSAYEGVRIGLTIGCMESGSIPSGTISFQFPISRLCNKDIPSEYR